MQNSDVKPVSWAGAQGSTTAGVPRIPSSASLAAGSAPLVSGQQTLRDELSRHSCRRCSNTEPSQMTYNSCPACPIPNNCIAGSKRWQLWSCDTNTWEPGYCTAYTGFDGQTGYNCDRCDRETIWGKLLEQSIRTVPCIFR